ncbi:hypothetical protein BTHERMOSOX_1205 [Bathymodiolus thermophilus thioautotrophic gill symbiont]|nr:hypothetical protein BTHERMOSOX_1205 [Bathymodiolus thermophilus thioautotrophic gill symbiont]
MITSLAFEIRGRHPLYDKILKLSRHDKSKGIFANIPH